MNLYRLNGEKFLSREKAYDYMGEVFRFPKYFGKNLDALWDLLTFEENLYIYIENARLIPRNLGDYGLNILDLFGDLAKIEGNKIEITW